MRQRKSTALQLNGFEAGLAQLVGRPTTLRPFVCEGSPLDCEIFIVGANPTTAVGDFWDFWHPEVGMGKTAWFEAYKTERVRQPLRPGKTHRPAVSPTRRNIDLVVEAASPFRCLETNVYSVASSATWLLHPIERTTEIFEFLLEAIEPRVILAHGKEAVEALRTLNISVAVEEVGHLSRTSAEQARALGEGLRTQLRSAV